MVLELNMDTSFSCVVQYVLFPPHSAHWGEGELYSSSEEDVEPESDAESELQMVTEVWIEPQFGVVKTSNSRIEYMNNKQYCDIADVVGLSGNSFLLLNRFVSDKTNRFELHTFSSDFRAHQFDVSG